MTSDEAVYQLIYASAATKPFSTAELKALLEKARENNTALDVTGMLTFHNSSFLQTLEGPEDVVERLFHAIQDDPRHDACRILYRGPSEEREFPEWSMAFVDAHDEVDGAAGFVNYVNGVEVKIAGKDGRGSRMIAMFKDGRWRQG